MVSEFRGCKKDFCRSKNGRVVKKFRIWGDSENFSRILKNMQKWTKNGTKSKTNDVM